MCVATGVLCGILTKANFKMSYLAVLFFGHLSAFVASMVMRIIIHKYLRRKPPGLQSVLDLLIIDLVSVQMFNYTFFMIFLLLGILHGHLPFLMSQWIILILQNSDVYVMGLFQCFLLIKAIVIFRGSWLAEVTDSWILVFYRTSAVVYTFIRCIGDYSIQKPKPGVLNKFLTGTEEVA